jgi:transmembrane sensor
MDPDSRREFQAWMRSPAHAKELARICLIDALLHHDPSLKREKRPALPENVIRFQSYAPAPAPRARVPQPTVAPASSALNTKIAIAAGMVLAVLLVAMVNVVTGNQVLVTREGRWDKQLLEDGSVVYVGPRTQLRFDFDAKTRSVTLVAGEALFEVAKEPDRPFIVTTDAGTVQAIGTEFATEDRGDEVLVTVTSGKVAVTAADGVQPILPVAANQQTVLTSSGASPPVAVDAEREVKWIRNWYEYDGEQVGEIIDQLNRRHEVKVIVNDPQIARLRMNSLSFKPSQPEDFVAKINQWYADYPQKADGSAGTHSGGVLHLERP